MSRHCIYLLIKSLINFVDLVPDNVCLRIKSAGWCKTHQGYVNWWQVCPKTCGNKEFCPTHEDNPSEQLPGEFHKLIVMSNAFMWGMPLIIS